ncbi:MAG: hypothetical protein U9R14_02055 [Patescibacteria group bacterium]|nr:hypothetical protein [Patescibacteria group bacterium]
MQKEVEVLDRKELFNEPILAQIKIDKDADFLPSTSFVDKAGKEVNVRKRYVLYRSIPGGYFKIFLYGAKAYDLGKKLTVKLTFHKKLTTGDPPHNKVYYFDAEVRRDNKTDIRLAIHSSMGLMMTNLPVIRITFNGNRPFFIGFTSKKR